MRGKVYVASSWRNEFQSIVVSELRNNDIDCYDFKKPKLHNDGFHWSEVMPSYQSGSYDQVPPHTYLEALMHPRAIEGFALDFNAMKECSICVLILPCGKSAHLELGWFAGQGKPTAILLEDTLVIPELMYKLVDYVTPSLYDLIIWVKQAVL